MESSAHLLAPKWQSDHGKVWKTLGLKHLKESWSVVCAETPGTSHDQQNCSLERDKGGKKGITILGSLWKSILKTDQSFLSSEISRFFLQVPLKAILYYTTHPLNPRCPSSNTGRKILLSAFPRKVAVPTTALSEFSNDHIEKQENYNFM